MSDAPDAPRATDYADALCALVPPGTTVLMGSVIRTDPGADNRCRLFVHSAALGRQVTITALVATVMGLEWHGPTSSVVADGNTVNNLSLLLHGNAGYLNCERAD